jgi:hypothetical protein
VAVLGGTSGLIITWAVCIAWLVIIVLLVVRWFGQRGDRERYWRGYHPLEEAEQGASHRSWVGAAVDEWIESHRSSHRASHRAAREPRRVAVVLEAGEEAARALRRGAHCALRSLHHSPRHFLTPQHAHFLSRAGMTLDQLLREASAKHQAERKAAVADANDVESGAGALGPANGGSRAVQWIEVDPHAGVKAVTTPAQRQREWAAATAVVTGSV